jgi:pheromone shutdown-related protein TraB
MFKYFTKMREIILVPVGHVFAESVEKVRSAIESVKPDAVAVELCPARFYAISGRKKTDYKALLRNRLFFAAILSFVQDKIARDLGVSAGEEMIAAVEEARKRNIPVLFIDRDIRETMDRLSSVSLREKLRLFFSITGKGKIGLEDLKDQDIIDSLVLELKKSVPNIYRALIEERDFIMSERLKRAEFGTIVAVIGAGHLSGMKRFLSAPVKE